MSLPWRNHRNITVQDSHYRWVKGSRGDDGRCPVTVQHANGAAKTTAKAMSNNTRWYKIARATDPNAEIRYIYPDNKDVSGIVLDRLMKLKGVKVDTSWQF